MQSKLSTLPAAQTFVLLRLAITVHVSDSSIGAGENGAYYAAACSIVSTLEGATKITEGGNSADSLLGDINAINLSAADPAFRKLINLDKDWADSAAKEEAGTKSFASDWEKRYGSWRAAAVEIKNNEAAYSEFKREKISSVAQKTIRAVTEAETALSTDSALCDQKSKIQIMVTNAKGALYESETGNDDEQAPDLTNRVNKCGKDDGTGGDIAGESLRTDIICICSKQGGDTGKYCCEGCDGAPATACAAKTNSTTIWKALKQNCATLYPTIPLSTATLTTAIAHLLSLSLKAQGTTTPKQFFLGTLLTTGAQGCAGSSANTYGYCVRYKKTTERSLNISKHTMANACQRSRCRSRFYKAKPTEDR
uniref:Variant surface glycoprotein 1553 n=1 Tax=Trypanosoma brucei TaxID=5691 RepID=M4T0F3_9TRYP|nr:variant surface glycoprotein 1553 [Trypanosoma brucei]